MKLELFSTKSLNLKKKYCIIFCIHTIMKLLKDVIQE